MIVTSIDRVNPTSVIGKSVQGVSSVQEALTLAGLDGKVCVSDNPVSSNVLTNSGFMNLSVSGKFLTYREFTDPYEAPQPLGVVGSRYVPIQDIEAFDFLNYLVDESGSKFDAVGTLDNGKQSFLSLKLPENVYVAGYDKVEMYLLARNSHDGSSSFTINVTPVRLRCTNQLRMITKTAKAKISLRHTFGATAKVAQARETLGLVFAYQEAFQNEVEELMSREYSDSQFEQFVERVFPLAEDAKTPQVTKVLETRSQVLGIWNSETETDIKGSRWGAYNAVTEYADWFKPVRGNALNLRAERILSGAGEAFKDRALQLL